MTKKPIIFIIVLFFLVTYISCSDIWGTTVNKTIVLNNKETIIDFSYPPKGTYKCKIHIKGKVNCDLSIYRTNNNLRFKPKYKISSGWIDKVIYSGDCYGERKGITITKQVDIKSKIKISYTYYY